jgi:ABC-2 type transport system ATP-binding protein
MKQKLALAVTLMHDPDLLLLDEPTTGVDPVARREFWRIIAGLHCEGITVLVATPYMDEAERCTEVAFMDNGKILLHETPSALKKRVCEQTGIERVSMEDAFAHVISEARSGEASA